MTYVRTIIFEQSLSLEKYCTYGRTSGIYIAYYTSKSGIWLVISRVASYFHEPKASANTAYE